MATALSSAFPSPQVTLVLHRLALEAGAMREKEASHPIGIGDARTFLDGLRRDVGQLPTALRPPLPDLAPDPAPDLPTDTATIETALRLAAGVSEFFQARGWDASLLGAARLYTHPAATPRPRPVFNLPEGSEILNPIAARDLLTRGSRLSDEDRSLYTHFVLARLEASPLLLEGFGLSDDCDDVVDLQGALEFFAERFHSVSVMRDRLGRTGVRCQGGTDAEPISRGLFKIMDRVPSDAVQFLLRTGKLRRSDGGFLEKLRERVDPETIQPKEVYDLDRLATVRGTYPDLTDEALRELYTAMCRDRLITQKILVELAKGAVKFAIMGAGHEACGTATALALAHEVGLGNTAISPHYRSGALVGEWARLHGHQEFALDSFRQMLSRDTDPQSRGRNMGSHYDYPQYHVLPTQSALGMNIGKLVGYLQGWKMQGRHDVVGLVEIGDGTTAASDFHEGLIGASNLELPMIFNIVDNNMAISVEKGGKTIKNMKALAEAHGAGFFTCDGNDALAVYETTRKAAAWARENQKPVILWTQNLSRLNGHSSSSGRDFDYAQPDALDQFGRALVRQDIIQEEGTMRRKPEVTGGSYLNAVEWGTTGEAIKAEIDAAWARAVSESEPTAASALEFVTPPLPHVDEPLPSGPQTAMILSAAIRGALAVILENRPLTWIWGEDIGNLGGVFQATAGLRWLFPTQVGDAPINEPLIVGSATGFALHPDSTAIPEIQFIDYVLNVIHWLKHLGHLYWATGGNRKANVIVRLPGEPVGGGAIYHSMSLTNLLSVIPGFLVLAPSTSFDAAGMLLSAVEYGGPVLFLEPKGFYRQTVGPALPGEPDPADLAAVAAFKDALGGTDGVVPVIPKDFRVPLGKAIVRRPGNDLTVVTFGSATVDCDAAAKDLSSTIDTELIDLRTLVPFDVETVLESVRKTGRLLIVQKDHAIGGIARHIQGRVQEILAREGRQIVTQVLGMDATPEVPQNVTVEKALVVTAEKVAAAAREIMGVPLPRDTATAIWFSPTRANG